MELSVCDINLKPGGKWRYVMRSPDGQEMGFHGVFSEIVRPEKLVHTYIFEPFPEHDAVVTVTFVERAGRTIVSETIVHKTKEARDGHLSSGMEAGASQSFDRLADLLATMA